MHRFSPGADTALIHDLAACAAPPTMQTLIRAWKAFCYGLGTLTCIFLLIQSWFLLHIVWWNWQPPTSTRFMEDRLAELRERNPKAELRQRWVSYRDISINIKRAVIVAEDAKFVDHDGFDLEGIERAIERNKKRGRTVAGGSTISQQLAKNLFLSGERTYWRKGEEAIITLMLEFVMQKERILELYLNLAEWGEGLFGCEAAARHYFGVSASALTPVEAARLAAMLPRPRFYDRHRDTLYLAGYSARILARMPQAQLP